MSEGALNMRWIIQKIVTVLFIIILAGCVSPYEKLGLGGGFSDFALTDGTYKISFRGNGYSSAELVQNYLLRRCAEITLQRGYKYFVILGANTSTKRFAWTTPAQIQSNSNGNFSSTGNGYTNNIYGNYNQNTITTINPSQTFIINRYTATAIIKMLNSNKNYQSALDAEFILSNFAGNA
jgi:hypothetical protein